jgi:hypothetical protein
VVGADHHEKTHNVNRHSRFFGALLLSLSLTAASGPAGAADLDVRPFETSPAMDDAALKAALGRYLDLLLIRATFDVVSADQVVTLLTDRGRAWRRHAPTGAELAEIDTALLAEGSYYIVSLQYVVEVGGAAFPSDRPEASYANDAIVQLQTLRDRYLDAVGNGDNLLPLLQQAERIRALTEGYSSVPAELDAFGQQPELLDETWAKLAGGTGS